MRLGLETGEGTALFPSQSLASQCPLADVTSQGFLLEVASVEQSGKMDLSSFHPPTLSPEASLQKGVDFIKHGWEPSLLTEGKPELGFQEPEAPPPRLPEASTS